MHPHLLNLECYTKNNVKAETRISFCFHEIFLLCHNLTASGFVIAPFFGYHYKIRGAKKGFRFLHISLKNVRERNVKIYNLILRIIWHKISRKPKKGPFASPVIRISHPDGNNVLTQKEKKKEREREIIT